MPEATEKTIARETGVTLNQVEAVRLLLDGGANIPFIARYRKEKTGSLDEVLLGKIKDGLARLSALDDRRKVILESLQEQGILTAELRTSVEDAATLSALEDIYLPYRPKRRTRATIAKEKGLEPLARAILSQNIADLANLALT